MTPAQRDLAARLVAHPRWPGKDDRPPDDVEVLVRPEDRWMWRPFPPMEDGSDEGGLWLPDLDDYATAAILLRMAMEAGADPSRKWLGDGFACAEALLAAWGEVADVTTVEPAPAPQLHDFTGSHGECVVCGTPQSRSTFGTNCKGPRMKP